MSIVKIDKTAFANTNKFKKGFLHMMSIQKLASIVIFLILAAAGGFAQTTYNAIAEVETVTYSSTATLFNGSSVPITLKSIDASGEATMVCEPTCHTYTAADGPIEFGIAPSSQEGQQCQTVQAFIFGSSTPAPVDGVRVTVQPCSANAVSFNPTKRCWGFYSVNCSLDLTSAPLVLQPGTGITVWAERYFNEQAFGWVGKATVSFRWQK